MFSRTIESGAAPFVRRFETLLSIVSRTHAGRCRVWLALTHFSGLSGHSVGISTLILLANMTEHKQLKILLAFVLIVPLVATAIWLPQSAVDLAPETVPALWKLFSSITVFLCISTFIKWRLARDDSAVARKIKYAAVSASYLCYAAIALTFSNFFMLSGSFLGASAAFPLYDGTYAQFSTIVGFDWLSVVSWFNQFPSMSKSLVWAYSSTLYQTPVLVFALVILHQKDRLLEYVALYSLTGLVTILFAIFMPALGAYVFHEPEAAYYSNFGYGPGISHLPIVEALRSGETMLVNFADPKGIVTFPSFHTILAIIATYSARDIKYFFPPFLALNLWVIVSTIPVGGHYVIDLIAGAALSFAAIWITKKLMAPNATKTGAPAEGYLPDSPQRA